MKVDRINSAKVLAYEKKDKQLRFIIFICNGEDKYHFHIHFFSVSLRRNSGMKAGKQVAVLHLFLRWNKYLDGIDNRLIIEINEEYT